MTRRLAAFSVAVLGSPRWPILAALLAVVLHLPAIDDGFQLDDHAHHATMTDSNLHRFDRTWWTMFDFIRPDRESDRELVEGGILPWWTEPDLQLGFWRPVAGLTHALDFTLWPDRPALMHAHSLLWLALTTVLVGVLLRRWIEPSWVAGLATLAFAVDDHHYAMAGWISNRNALIGLTFGVGALILHDRWRRDGRALDGMLSVGALGLAVLANEGAVAVGAFLVGHALWLDRGTARERCLALVPATCLGVVWLAVRAALDYGTFGSAVYVDPLADPAAFVAILIERLPILLNGIWLFPGGEIGPLLTPDGLAALKLRGVLATVIAAWMLWPVLRRRPEARVLTLGAAAALVPVCATLPAGRLLAFTSVGAAAWLALPAADLRKTHRVRHLLGVFVLGIHLIVSPFLIVFGLKGFADMERGLRTFATSLPDEPELAEQTAIVVQAPSAFLAGFSPMILAEEGRPTARRMFVLTPGIDGVTVERLDDRTIVLRPEPIDPAEHLPLDLRRLLRQLDGLVRDKPFTVGEQATMPDATVTVTAVADGRPTEITVRFAEPLEDPSYRWFGVRGWSYRPFEPPTIGDSVTLGPVFPIAAPE